MPAPIEREAANLFIPFEVRNKVEDMRRRLETRARGTYGGDPSLARLFAQIDSDLLDLIEIVDLVLKQTRIEDMTP